MSIVAINNADDLATAVQLLTRGFSAKPASIWSAFFDRMQRLGSNAAAGVPFGYLLSGSKRPTGVMVTPASTRVREDGTAGAVINLSSWYVEPEERWRASRMLQSVLKRHDAMFTDLTPTAEVQAMLPALGFVPLNHGVVITALPVAAALPADDAIVVALAEKHAALMPKELFALLSAHREVGCLPAMLELRDRSIPLLFRRRMLKGVPAAKLLYCSDLAAFQAAIPAVARFLLKQGIALLMSDDHGLPLRTGQLQRRRGLKFARPGGGLAPAPVATDHAASELALLDF